MSTYSELLFIGGQLIVLLYWNIHAFKQDKISWRKKSLRHLAYIFVLFAGIVYLILKTSLTNSLKPVDYTFTVPSFFIITGFVFSLVASFYYYLQSEEYNGNKFYSCFKLIEIAALIIFSGFLMKITSWSISFSTFLLLLFHVYLIAFFLKLKF